MCHFLTRRYRHMLIVSLCCMASSNSFLIPKVLVVIELL